MHDYVDGKVDWMAYGLPVEGEDGPFLGQHLEAPTTCDIGSTVAEARSALAAAGDGTEVLVLDGGLVVGDVDAGTLEGEPDDAPLLDVLRPVPSTVRPSVTVASVAGAGGGSPIVTSSDGRLLGRAAVEGTEPGGDDHAGHDHGGHDHEGSSAGDDGLEQEVVEVLEALQERFGDREPSAEEVQGFLRERLLAEGRTPEEADQVLRQLADGDAG